MTQPFPIALRHATSYLVVAASLLTPVTPACDTVINPAAVDTVAHSPDGFSVKGLVNSFQCRRLCSRTTGCSAVVLDSDISASSTNCTMILNPPTSTTNEQQAAQEDGDLCQLTCDDRPCGYGETCFRGYTNTGPTYRCHSLLRCADDPPFLSNGYQKTQPQDRGMGTTVEYSCDALYVLERDSSNVTCSYTGHWTRLGKCIPTEALDGYDTRVFGVNTTNLTFHEAESWCNKYGGHLVGFEDDGKWNAVAEALRRAETVFVTEYIYVDGFEHHDNDTFYLWNDQVMKIVTGWYTNEPNSYGPEPENCLAVAYDFKLFDEKCSRKYNFICEILLNT